MKFKKSLLADTLAGDCDSDVITTISDRIIDKGRWVDIYRWIFKFEDRFFSTTYRTGSTENCDERPFEFDGEEIEVTEVFPVNVTVVKYMTEEQRAKHNANL